MAQTKKTNGISLSGLWLTVVLLVILILATLALLGSFISAYAAGEPNVIEVMADSNALGKEYGSDLPAGALPRMEAEDPIVRWETETSVDLFKNAYVGPDGSVTVESANGDKLIAPGTENTYTFTIKNTGNIALDYTLILDGVFRLADQDIPMFIRLSQDGSWIMGTQDSWLHVADMENISETDTLPRGKSTTYLFEWKWPYEMNDDTRFAFGDLLDTVIASDHHDTQLGGISFDVDSQFKLNIRVTSEVNSNAIAEFEGGGSVLTRYIFVCSMLALILGSGLWLLILLFLGRDLYFTGLVTPPLPGAVLLDKEDAPLFSGRFTFPKARLGKHTLNLNDMETTIRFRRSLKVRGLSIAGSTVTLGVDIRAVELYFLGTELNPAQWAAIDKDHNVHTPLGVVPAVNKCNRTPAGLTVDQEGSYGLEDLLHV